MKMRAIALCAAALLLPFTVACSADDSGGKKDGSDENITVGGSTVDQLSEMLQEAGLPEQQADCMARAYGKLDLTEEQLKQLQQGDTSVLDSKDMAAYAKAAADCLSE